MLILLNLVVIFFCCKQSQFLWIVFHRKMNPFEVMSCYCITLLSMEFIYLKFVAAVPFIFFFSYFDLCFILFFFGKLTCLEINHFHLRSHFHLILVNAGTVPIHFP